MDSLARWPPRFAYHVWLWTRSAPARLPPSSNRSRGPAEPPCRARAPQEHPRAGERRPSGRRQRSDGVAPAVHRHASQPGELPREVLDVHARTPVDVRRVLAREQRDRPSCLDADALLDHDDRRSRRSGSARGRPRGRLRPARPGAIRTFLSTIALRTTAPRPTSTSCMSDRALDERVRVHVDAGRENRAAHGSARHDDARAHHRVHRHAGASVLLEDELRGRQRFGPGEDRPVLVVEIEDRVDRDQVHVRVVVRVERSDVAPVGAVRSVAPGIWLFAKSQTQRLRRARRASG